MKLCIFNNVFPPVTSGSSHFVNDLAQRMAERGHEVTVITSRFPGTKKTERIGKVNVERLPCIRLPRTKLTLNYSFITFTFLPWNIARVYRIIRKNDFDILQAHGQIFDLFISAVLCRKKFKKPLVLSIHTYVQHTSKAYNAILTFLDKTFVRMLVKRCDALVAGEKNTVKYVDERYKAAKKIWYHPAIISPVEIEKKVTVNVRKKWGIKDDEKVILSVGHVQSLRKRLSLIRAMPRILQEFPKTKVLIVGDVYTQEPFELAKKLGVESSIIRCGRVEHKDIYSYIAAADIETHELDLGFGFSKASLEAMAAGKPVIVAVDEDYFGKGVLKNWENVVLVPKSNHNAVAKAIIKLLKDEKLREKIGANAEVLVKSKFNWNSTCSSFEKLYAELLKKKTA